MSQHIPAALKLLVTGRANGFCEYCHLPQSTQEATFHIDHIQPHTANGPTVADNLALACVTCSLRKASRTKARDPKSGKRVSLFHPRQDRWSDHFRWLRSGRVAGRTPTGRAKIDAFAMNRPAIIAIRQTLAKLGEFPPLPAE